MAVEGDVAVRVAGRPAPAESTAADGPTYGPVHLDVRDESRSLAFWRDLIGLQVLGRGDDTVRLGVADADLLVLHPGAVRPAARGHSGLYHLAIHLPSEAEFARVLGRLLTRQVPNSPTDHIMHWATYLDDPDGIGLELSFETLDRFGGYVGGSGRPMILDSDGRRRGGVEPLDLQEVFSHLPNRDLERALPAGTRIGHLHLHVGAIEPALAFYELVGFSANVNLWGFGMADMSAGGSFPHRLALNTWQGEGVSRPPAGTAGLRHSVVSLRSDAELTAAIVALEESGAAVTEASDGTVDGAVDGAMVADPSGNRTLLSAAPESGDR